MAIVGGRLCLTLWVTDKDVLVLAGKTFPRPAGLETVERRGPVCKSLPLLLNRATRDMPLSQSVVFNHVKLSNTQKEINTGSGRFTDSLEDNGGGGDRGRESSGAEAVPGAGGRYGLGWAPRVCVLLEDFEGWLVL